ncbi:MAG TPA: two-component sensor histidine kinase [Spirochaeta sp.]|nr:two-component sensor histidine kinase [Spirochaeta sp.]
MILRSFYARISLLFLALILLLGGASLIIAFNASEHLFDEVEQLLNREYAMSIADELKPLIGDPFTEENIKDAIHYMMVLNPIVEIYLLNSEGLILCYFAGPDDQVVRNQIDLKPLRLFSDSDGFETVLGDDPRTESSLKPFSAAPLVIDNDDGWVYVILRGQSYDRSLAMLRSNYYISSGLITFIIAMLATAVVGLSLFFVLTRRLRALNLGVEAFARGQLDHRVEISGKDELANLGNAFNDMAQSIEEGVKQIHDADKQRGELIANISHDLRSPLTSIRGHLETILIKDDKLSASERRDFLETSLKNVSGFQKLVEELFDLAKLEARQTTPQIQLFSMAELIQDVVLKLKPQSDEKAIKISWIPSAGFPAFEGDIGLIERVLTNILENAVSHTPYGGRIQIGLEHYAGSLEISIDDTGPGISPEDLPHIFERFYRADKSRSRDRKGTGLGLAIAKEVVELHNGRILAESSEGAGAVFRISLPL